MGLVEACPAVASIDALRAYGTRVSVAVACPALEVAICDLKRRASQDKVG
jgi:hypothetical protein